MIRRSMFAGLCALALSGAVALAADAPKSVSGKSSCATCTGVTTKGHNIMLVTEDGTRWVLVAAEGAKGYKEAHKVRQQGKQMTAALAGEPETKKDANGKEYKEAKVSEVTVVG